MDSNRINKDNNKVEYETTDTQDREEYTETNDLDQTILKENEYENRNTIATEETEKKVAVVEEEREAEIVYTETNNDDNTASEEDIKAAWTQAWDDNSQAYYWWNTITYESAWEDPNTTDYSTTPVTDNDNKNNDDQLDSNKNEEDDNNNDDNNENSNEDKTPQVDSYESITNTELDSVLDVIDREVKAKLDGKTTTTASSSSLSSSLQANPSINYDYNNYYYNTQQQQYGTQDPYQFQAHFNSKTGKFQTSSDVDNYNPEQYSMEARAKRQMEHYFDVDSYQDQRNNQAQQHRGQKRPLSKKEIEKFKQAKKEKKVNRMRGWLRD